MVYVHDLKSYSNGMVKIEFTDTDGLKKEFFGAPCCDGFLKRFDGVLYLHLAFEQIKEPKFPKGEENDLV